MFSKWMRIVAMLGLVLGPVVPAYGQNEIELEVVAELREAPGNITLTPDGRMIISLHQFYGPKLRVAEVGKDGSLKPFPNAAWNADEGPYTFDAVLGIQSDTRGVVWMLDNGGRRGTSPKLVGWDTTSNKLARVIEIPPDAAPEGSFLNDLAIDSARQVAFIVDTGNIGTGKSTAIVVVDLKNGHYRRLLHDHASVVAKDEDFVAEGRTLKVAPESGDPFSPRVAADPVGLGAQNVWLYFGPMTGDTLYRVRTADLLDETLNAGALEAKVEVYGPRPYSDGISVDAAGNVYISAVQSNALGVLGSDGKYRELMRDDDRLAWPDAMSYGPDGMLYIVVNQLHRTALLNAGKSTSKPPFYIVRFRPLADGVTGR
ncbi:MAG: L-dopachrome tautomerase-related protein [Hyphomicrobiales bacterium]